MTTLPPEGNENTAPQPDQSPEMPAAPAVPPAAPAAPGYVAPPPPSYPQQAPPAPGYGAPQQPGYAQKGVPPQGYAPQGAPAADPTSNLTLNYWLSVFFAWLPALIFYIIEKDKGNPQSRALHTSNLNFSLLRTAVAVAGSIFAGIPVLGWIILLVAVIANIALFVLHIMAALKVQDAYRAGQADPFMFNIPLIK